MAARTGRLSLTIDEIVATLSHSSLPTVVVEGSDDMIVFRKLEEFCANLGLSVLPAGGRKSVLQIFDRRDEFENHRKIAFVADRDTWVLTEIPAEYDCGALIFTTGYSIENDIYIDGAFERLMTAEERIRFSTEMNVVIEWFALALSRRLAGECERIRTHPNEILEDEVKRLERLTLRPGERYPTNLRDAIFADYQKLLRGKTLIGVLMRQLSYAGRPARHNHLSLFEMVAHNRGPLLNNLFDRVQSVFG